MKGIRGGVMYLEKEAVSSYETIVSTYKSIWCHDTE
jgi:hypothetical protein